MFRDLVEGNHHEVALVHQWMRYLEVGLVNCPIVVKQDVDIDRAVGVFTIYRLSIYRFLPASHIAFNLLRQQKHLAWCLCGFTEYDGIREHVF